MMHDEGMEGDRSPMTVYANLRLDMRFLLGSSTKKVVCDDLRMQYAGGRISGLLVLGLLTRYSRRVVLGYGSERRKNKQQQRQRFLPRSRISCSVVLVCHPSQRCMSISKRPARLPGSLKPACNLSVSYKVQAD